MARRFDQRSDEAKAYRKLYNTRRWRRRRKSHIDREPLCRMCLARGVINNGSRRIDGSPQPDKRRRFLVADHIKEHKGNLKLFWEGELQTLCPDHHDSVKQAEERRGFTTEVGLDGWPVDPNHPASR